MVPLTAVIAWLPDPREQQRRLGMLYPVPLRDGDAALRFMTAPSASDSLTGPNLVLRSSTAPLVEHGACYARMVCSIPGTTHMWKKFMHV